jgi:hypothetical protein
VALSIEQIAARVESLRYRSNERDGRNLDRLVHYLRVLAIYY